MLFGAGLLGLNPSCSLSKAKCATEAQIANMRLFEIMFNYFSNLAVTRYEWRGLPESVNERFLNQTLYLFGNACFFEDESKGYMALPCTLAGEYNVYYEPTQVNAYSFNYNKLLSYNEFVFIRNNPTCTPTALYVMEWVARMCDVIRSIDVLCKKMKQPFIILCDEKQRQTYLNLIKKVNDNEVIILGMKDYDLNKALIEIKETRIDVDLAKLWEVYHSYENLLYTYLGINHSAENKRERLLVDEVNANNMALNMSIEVNIKELQTACENINQKYGLDISVSAKGVTDYIREEGQPVSDYDNPVGGEE